MSSPQKITANDPNSYQAKSLTTNNWNGKEVVVAGNQTSKGWFVVAIIVGTLVVVGVGGCGISGLLHQAGIALPQWLASAVGTIGCAGAGLMTGAGLILGESLVVFGIYKINGPYEKVNTRPELFSEDYFAVIGENKEFYSNLKEDHFIGKYLNDDLNQAFIVLNNGGILQSTKLMTQEQYNQLDKELIDSGLTYAADFDSKAEVNNE